MVKSLFCGALRAGERLGQCLCDLKRPQLSKGILLPGDLKTAQVIRSFFGGFAVEVTGRVRDAFAVAGPLVTVDAIFGFGQLDGFPPSGVSQISGSCRRRDCW